MNTSLLRKIAADFKAHPEKLFMADWGVLQECNTMCCIGGDALLQHGATVVKLRFKSNYDGELAYRFKTNPSLRRRLRRHFVRLTRHGYIDDPASAAAAVLQLSPTQAQRLFLLQMWPPKYSEMYGNAKTAKGRAQATIRRINRFIASNGRS
jgi:hypothetical protein